MVVTQPRRVSMVFVICGNLLAIVDKRDKQLVTDGLVVVVVALIVDGVVLKGID